MSANEDETTDELVAIKISVQEPPEEGFSLKNPLVTAALIERASIDGDVPELRSWPLPEDAKPAVPVLTDSLNPVLVGLMLERASAEVDALLKVAEASNSLMQGSMLPSVPGYTPGDFPELREVAEPPATVLLELDPQQKRAFAWKAVSTTQGRRSLLRPMEQHLAEKTGKRAGTPRKSVKETRWMMTVFGPEDLFEDFSPVEAALNLFTGVLEKTEAEVFQVIQVADYPNRKFGWALRTGVE